MELDKKRKKKKAPKAPPLPVFLHSKNEPRSRWTEDHRLLLRRWRPREESRRRQQGCSQEARGSSQRFVSLVCEHANTPPDSRFFSLFCLFDLFYVRVLHLYTVVYYGIIREYLKKKKRPICIKQQRQALIMQPPLAYIVTHDTNRRHRQGGASRERAAARDQETSPAEEI